MTITDPEFIYLNGLPACRLLLDGQPVTIPVDQKPYLIKNGIVSLGVPPDSMLNLPPVTVPPSRAEGIKGQVFDNGQDTKDRGVLRLAKQLIAAVEAGTFEEGPVK